MKYPYIALLLLLLFNCKNDKRQDNVQENEKTEQTKSLATDTVPVLERTDTDLDKSISIEIKQKKLIDKKDERDQFQNLILDKSYLKDQKDYTINFKYPLLNESLKPTHVNFNNFMNDYYVNVSKTISDIEQNKLLCDSITAKTFREERFIDYKIYGLNDQLVSVLFYKENFYSGAMHPSYSFDCFNFDLNSGVFMTYESFFAQGSEDELLNIINGKINKKMATGELYYDCWELSSSDFFESKNNFVLNDTYLEFYFAIV
ncbi:hypothetical protein ESY86_07020 [Subsaximicrobium wynnwilliamsii]|uniref:DUF4163 domain-containing protein n=1 Tax=Subsaximicrobium wynnwilliamsii TaxID=291179 RepID=A0A5C6ZJ54_9FLAO|nr:hypothetical protein [Subsaximicrobium wynnwilliamsii]TXD81581.1 hypothetical protein ESY87_17635 [Subsaximicrobium wynnwilliamsii]TXD89943.1 hypothetical protein ESY86_07020 [Subsaximicrobium wynnwilliamsii]TXE01042.1 hypothetical protein ESY88_17630 [Subsaximicrobium wynnwilliamsii]